MVYVYIYICNVYIQWNVLEDGIGGWVFQFELKPPSYLSRFCVLYVQSRNFGRFQKFSLTLQVFKKVSQDAGGLLGFYLSGWYQD